MYCDWVNETGKMLCHGNIEATGSICNSTGSCVGGSVGSAFTNFFNDNITIGNVTVNASIYPYVDSYWADARMKWNGRLTANDWIGSIGHSADGSYAGNYFYDEDTGVGALFELNPDSNYFSFESYNLPLWFTSNNNTKFTSRETNFTGTSGSRTTVNIYGNETVENINATSGNIGNIRFVSNATGDYQFMNNWTIFSNATYKCEGLPTRCPT